MPRPDASIPVRLPLLAVGEPMRLRAPRAPAERLLQVGDLARASGKTVRAIHHYEELGLLKPDARSKGRFRLYDPGAVTRVRWIGKLHDLGMSLAQIQGVVEAWERAPTAAQAMAEVRAMYRAKLEETRAQVRHLQALERELEASVAYLDTCDSCDPTALLGDLPAPLKPHDTASTCNACQLRERDQEPELVAGIVAG
jgi:MerR family copper efflux transcriptional regulator